MELPIFPLNGAVLFPGTNLPLNIFEERYLQMVDYSLSKKRFIGMIQTNQNQELYNIGCVGKINSFSETNDGRYLISLEGTDCFKVNKEVYKDFKFRLVDAKLIKNYHNVEKLSDEKKVKLLKKYEDYAKIKGMNISLEEVKKIDISQIVKFIAMISPFKDEDKQVLLETSNLNEFYNKLLSIIEIELVGDLTNKTIN